MRSFVDLTLNENDKKLLFIFLFIFIILFIILGLIGVLIRRISKLMASRMDYEIHEAVTYRVITTPGQLRKYGRAKNRRRFFIESLPVFGIIVASALTYVVNSLITGSWADDYFGNFGKLFYQWDWANEDNFVTFWGLKLLAQWPPVSNVPTFTLEHLGSYVLCVLWILAIIYFVVVTQAFISRAFMLNRRCHTVFGKSLEGFNYFQDDKEKGAPIPEDASKK